MTHGASKALADKISSIIHRHVRSKPDKNFTDRQWLVGVQEAADEIAFLAPSHEAGTQEPTDEQLTEWVQHLDWDTGLSTPDEIKQLRALLKRIGYAVPAGTQEPVAWNGKTLTEIADDLIAFRRIYRCVVLFLVSINVVGFS